MSNNRLRYDGLEELKAALRALPRELADEAGAIVGRHVEAARDDIVAEYKRHERTGTLADRVYITKGTRGQYGAAAVVKSAAPHAWLFENGTQARHTKIGANRGTMPPGHAFIPRLVKHRRAMYDDLKVLVASKGLKVSGDA